MTPANELSEGLEALNELEDYLKQRPSDQNEANTRFHIIDNILVRCLGIPASIINLEPYTGNGYADYLIDEPASLVVEAKREGKTFELPLKIGDKSIHSLQSLRLLDDEVRSAIHQVNKYATTKGCRLAIATNGHQIIAFQAYHNEGRSGNALVISSLSHLKAIFPRVWMLLSYPALGDNRLSGFLDRSISEPQQEKLSAYIPDYPRFRNRTNLQASLKIIGDLLLLGVENHEDLEEAFFENCYVETGGLSQKATISKNILSARYAALFDAKDEGANLVSVKPDKKTDTFTPELLSEALSNKPILLVGDVGVGKSSFIKHLRHVSAFDEFRHAIYVYIDLAYRGALQSSVEEIVLREIERTLLDQQCIDIFENQFVRKVYKSDLRRFESGVYGSLKRDNPDDYLKHEIDYLGELIQNRSEHIRRSLSYLATVRRKQIIIAIDNSDKRNSAVQQAAFIIAQNIASTWKAAVFVTMRPSTYFMSRRSGALSAYQSRVFTISPPRLDLVLNKRLAFALEIAEGKRAFDQLKVIRLSLPSVVAVLNSLIPSIDKSDELKRFLENITSGNVRLIIEFLAEFMSSPNVDMDLALKVTAEGGSFIFPLHDFWKVALKGEFDYFDPTKAMATNLFDVYSNDSSEHFLAPLLLAFLNKDGSQRSNEGFVKTTSVLRELQRLGFNSRSIEACIRQVVNDNLAETSLRVSFEEDDFGLYGPLPDQLRITTAGAYYIDYWIGSFSYLDAVSVDMRIFDESVKEGLIEEVRFNALQPRLTRAIAIREYLSNIWTQLNLSVNYFNWLGVCSAQEWTFSKVESAIEKRGG